jgi:M6 family metalloprotease-like protein
MKLSAAIVTTLLQLSRVVKKSTLASILDTSSIISDAPYEEKRRILKNVRAKKPQAAMAPVTGQKLQSNTLKPIPINLDINDKSMNRISPQSVLLGSGTKKMLMIPFKFSNHLERVLPSTENLTTVMNNEGAHELCPAGSVKDYFLANSFDLFEIDSTVAPWVTVPKTEVYYANGYYGESLRSHVMIRDALNALESTGFNFTNFDTDMDGNIDAIGFFHSGYDAAFDWSDEYGTSAVDRIKSHLWTLYSLPGGKWTSKSGISVAKYHISSSLWSTGNSEIVHIGTIVYQTARFFGLPNLDDTKGAGVGIGKYCLMSSGQWGWDDWQQRPTHMSAWSKIKAGWIVPTVITSAGVYTARSACAFPDVFKISKNFPENEYLLIENRYPCKYDAQIPGPGLAIYHIDDSKKDNNYAGYPDQPGWPKNGKHYRVALLPADGCYELEGAYNYGSCWNSYNSRLFGNTKSIGPGGISIEYAYPNTNSYQNGTINDTCITVKNIEDPSKEMSFEISFDCEPS